MQTKNIWLSRIVLYGAIACPLVAAPTLTLTPSGLSGLAGTTTGWGFTITNDTGYLEVTSAQFCLAPVSFPACSAPVSGVFTDFISGFNSIIVGPPGGTLPDSVSQVFNAAGQTGIGSFVIGALSPALSFESGSIVLTYNLTDLDPNDSNATFLGSSILLADASVLVTEDTSIPLPVPEPGATLLAGVALVSMGWRLARSARRPACADRGRPGTA